jgi:hypothetical protein
MMMMMMMMMMMNAVVEMDIVDVYALEQQTRRCQLQCVVVIYSTMMMMMMMMMMLSPLRRRFVVRTRVQSTHNTYDV